MHAAVETQEAVVWEGLAMTITIGQVYRSTVPECPLQGIYRVLRVTDDDQVVMIQIPDGPRGSKNSEKKNYYVRGFLARPVDELEALIEKNQLIETKLQWPALWNLPDKEIAERYPPRKADETSYPLAIRDEKWKAIEPTVCAQKIETNFDFMSLDKLASDRAIQEGINVGKMLDALHRYFAYGCVKNALIPNKFNSGAPGKRKKVKTKGMKLGRRNAAAAVGNVELQGLVLEDKDIQNMQDGWELLVRPGTSVSEAYLAMCSFFYAKEMVMEHGVWKPILLDARLKPTEREFRYWGPLGGEGAAARRLMGEGEWSKNYRELFGTACSGVLAFGQVGSMDLSPIDINLTAIFDRLRPIGVGRCIVVKDVRFDLYMGWHVAVGGIGVEAANMAALRAATEKTDLLKRYGMEYLGAENFPFVFYTKFLSDNGELRCLEGIGTSVENLGSRIEFIKSNSPDLNAVSESGHHSRHRGLDHKLVGTNKGRQKKRGEPAPIRSATLTQHEYNRQLIRWIFWKNTQEHVPHMLTIEMRRDKVEPTRIAMYRWAIKNGYVAGKPMDPTYMKAHLLPTYTCTIRRNGLILHRPKTGDAVELLHGARFSDPYLASSGLIRRAMNGGKKHVNVKADPDDLSQVFLNDENGIHIIRNASDDLILTTEGCIADLCAMQDADRLKNVESATQTDQDKSDARAFRVEEEGKAKREKEAAMTKAWKRRPKTDRPSVKQNQQDESRAQLDAAVGRASSYDKAGDVKPTNSGSNKSQDDGANSGAPIPTGPMNLNDLAQQKLHQFHQTRGA